MESSASKGSQVDSAIGSPLHLARQRTRSERLAARAGVGLSELRALVLQLGGDRYGRAGWTDYPTTGGVLIRLSVNEDGEAASPRTQMLLCAEYCAKWGIDPTEFLYDECSGFLIDETPRVLFRSWLADICATRRVEAVVTTAVDRYTRDWRTGGEYLAAQAAARVHLYEAENLWVDPATLPITSDDVVAVYLEKIKAAWLYSSKLRRKQRQARERKQFEGSLLNGYHNAFGHDRSPDGSGLVKSTRVVGEQAEWEWIEELMRRLGAGELPNSVLTDFTARGLTSRNGNAPTLTWLLSIAGSLRMCGWERRRDYLNEEKWIEFASAAIEPIVDRELFDHVQATLARRRTVRNRRKPRACPYTHVLTCPCGEPMISAGKGHMSCRTFNRRRNELVRKPAPEGAHATFPIKVCDFALPALLFGTLRAIAVHADDLNEQGDSTEDPLREIASKKAERRAQIDVLLETLNKLPAQARDSAAEDFARELEPLYEELAALAAQEREVTQANFEREHALDADSLEQRWPSLEASEQQAFFLRVFSKIQVDLAHRSGPNYPHELRLHPELRRDLPIKDELFDDLLGDLAKQRLLGTADLYGYKRVPLDVEDYIYEMHEVEGVTPLEIARRLNDERVPTAKGGKEWRQWVVRDVLKRAYRRRGSAFRPNVSDRCAFDAETLTFIFELVQQHGNYSEVARILNREHPDAVRPSGSAWTGTSVRHAYHVFLKRNGAESLGASKQSIVRDRIGAMRDAGKSWDEINSWLVTMGHKPPQFKRTNNVNWSQSTLRYQYARHLEEKARREHS